jgi:hypothetical protein
MMRACFVLVLVVLGSPIALAEEAPGRLPPSTEKAARDAMEDYFAGEKLGGYILGGLGAAGLGAGVLLYRSSSMRARGASYPLLTVGLLHLAAGIFIYVSSNGRIDKFGAEIERDALGFVEKERPRMKGVSTQFTVLKIAEVVLIAGGLAMAGVGWRTDRPRLTGAGLALALEMGLTLGFDIWAAGRAHEYRDELARLDASAGLESPDDRPLVLIGHSGAF